MPYLVLTLEEVQAKGGFDRSPTETLTACLNSMEDDGYALVAVEPPAEGAAGSSYVFHRPGAGDAGVGIDQGAGSPTAVSETR